LRTGREGRRESPIYKDTNLQRKVEPVAKGMRDNRATREEGKVSHNPKRTKASPRGRTKEVRRPEEKSKVALLYRVLCYEVLSPPVARMGMRERYAPSRNIFGIELIFGVASLDLKHSGGDRLTL
jgi:hypothetical protein